MDSASQWLDEHASGAVVIASATASVAAKATAARDGPSRAAMRQDAVEHAAPRLAAVSASAS